MDASPFGEGTARAVPVDSGFPFAGPAGPPAQRQSRPAAPAPAPAVAAPDVVTRAELDTIRQAINALTTVVMSNQRQGGQDNEDFQ